MIAPFPQDPPWLMAARLDLGTAELHGAPTAPKIAGWLMDLGAWWRDDETPWCGTAVAHWLKTAGQPLPEAWYRARAWADWGVAADCRALGAVAVFERAGGGHVGLLVGVDADDHLMILGGNQGDAVRISPFDPARLVALRWPLATTAVVALAPRLTLYGEPVSSNEA